MKITVQDYRRTQKKKKKNTGKPRRGMDGKNWRGLRSGLRWIAFG